MLVGRRRARSEKRGPCDSLPDVREQLVKARAIVFTGPNSVAVRGFELRAPRADEVLVETEYTCISPGTELRRLHGEESVGGAPFPLVPGYCLAGRVLACGPEADVAEGAPVVTFVSVDAGGLGLAEGGHVSHALTPLAALARVPDGVGLVEASASVLAGIAHHGMRMARPVPGESVAVIGLGVIGQLAARLCKASGADVIGCDISPHRVAVANAAGVESVAPKVATDLKEAFAPLFPEGADLIVDCTGVAEVLPHAMQVGRRHAWSPTRDMPSVRYEILGTYHGDFVVPYAAAYAGQYIFMVPSGSQVGDCEAALGMMNRGEIRVRDVISNVRSPEAAAETYRELQDPNGRLLTAVFDWKGRGVKA